MNMTKMYYVHIYIILSLVIKNSRSQYPYYQNQVRYDNYNDMHQMDTVYDYEDSSECSCSCQTCENIKPCCKNVCANCFQQSPSSIVIVPYPYPFLISTKQKEVTTKVPTTQQTQQTHVQTEAPEETTTGRRKLPTEYVPPEEYLRHNEAVNDFIAKPPQRMNEHNAFNDVIAKAPRMNDKNKFVLTSLRRTKSNWMPKYGIVPIPDNLAERLMLQLRSMKVLHPKKNALRPKNIVPPFQMRQPVGVE